MKSKEIYNDIRYEVLILDNKKLSHTQMKREWRIFVKDKEYSKVKTTFTRTDGAKINETMYFKDGKFHNEFEPAIERILVSDVIREYYLDGKKIKYTGNNWTEYVINYKRSKILKETLNERIQRDI